jgi:hypothetical protein
LTRVVIARIEIPGTNGGLGPIWKYGKAQHPKYKQLLLRGSCFHDK